MTRKMGSNNNNELNSPDFSLNGSKDKELFFFFRKAADTFSSLSDPVLPILASWQVSASDHEWLF